MFFSFVGNTSIGANASRTSPALTPGARPARSPATGSSSRRRFRQPLVQTRDFKGDFLLCSGMLLPVGTKFPARIDIAGDGSQSHVLCLGNMFWAPCPNIGAEMVWHDTSKPAAKAGMLLCNLNGGNEAGLKGGFGRLENRGQADDAFLLTMLGPLRAARFWEPGPAVPGVTNVRLHRVICAAGKDATCLELRGR